MQNKFNIYQYLANSFDIIVYVAYTCKSKPTTSYKIYQPNKDPVKEIHGIDNMEDYTFLYKFHTKGLIFFARMGKRIVHIDPWPINDKECFNNGLRNSIGAIFPESPVGSCLKTAIMYELTRHDIVPTENISKTIEKSLLF